MAEEKENVLEEQKELTEVEKAELKKQAVNYFKKETQFLKVRADYEEQLMRIATYQRDALFAELDIARFKQQQAKAQEEFEKSKTENVESPNISEEKTNE